MPNNKTNLLIDIKEDDLRAMSAEVFDTLLRDHTTGQNILWATHDYETLGKEYDYHAQILPELITGDLHRILSGKVPEDSPSEKYQLHCLYHFLEPLADG